MASATPVRLDTLATLIRSKNAGPFCMTIDIVFREIEDLRTVVEHGLLSKEVAARLMDIDTKQLSVYVLPETRTVKLTFPRVVPAGNIGDRDLYGCQAFGPIAAIEVPAIDRGRKERAG